MTELPEEGAYTVNEDDGGYEVRSPTGRCVIACADQHSADHYANLLSEAFANGWRAARRAARESAGS